MSYACIQRYFNNGHVSVHVEESDHAPGHSSFEASKICDIYIDVFATKKLAENFAEEAKNA